MLVVVVVVVVAVVVLAVAIAAVLLAGIVAAAAAADPGVQLFCWSGDGLEACVAVGERDDDVVGDVVADDAEEDADDDNDEDCGAAGVGAEAADAGPLLLLLVVGADGALDVDVADVPDVAVAALSDDEVVDVVGESSGGGSLRTTMPAVQPKRWLM